jgi:hypothetical protein
MYHICIHGIQVYVQMYMPYTCPYTYMYICNGVLGVFPQVNDGFLGDYSNIYNAMHVYVLYCMYSVVHVHVCTSAYMHG